MGNHEKQNRVTLTDLMSNWWSKHPVGPLAPLGWDAVADCEYQGEQGILVKNHITGARLCALWDGRQFWDGGHKASIGAGLRRPRMRSRPDR